MDCDQVISPALGLWVCNGRGCLTCNCQAGSWATVWIPSSPQEFHTEGFDRKAGGLGFVGNQQGIQDIQKIGRGCLTCRQVAVQQFGYQALQDPHSDGDKIRSEENCENEKSGVC